MSLDQKETLIEPDNEDPTLIMHRSKKVASFTNLDSEEKGNANASFFQLHQQINSASKYKENSEKIITVDASSTSVNQYFTVKTSSNMALSTKKVKKKKWWKNIFEWRKDDVEIEELKLEVSYDEHTLSIGELEVKYDTNHTNGLSIDDSEARMTKYGLNVITPPKSTSEIIKFLKHMFSGFSSLLLLAGTMCLLLFTVETARKRDYKAQEDNLYLGLVLYIVVILTSCFSYYQEATSARLMKGFLQLIPQEAKVIRGGEEFVIDAKKLVIGDLVKISTGDRIPADVRLVHAERFKVDNSALTGESEPCNRAVYTDEKDSAEAENLAFFSTFAVEGQCQGIVIRTGDNTRMGRMASLTGRIKESVTPIAQEIIHFIKIISIVAVALGLLAFTIFLFTPPEKSFILYIVSFIATVKWEFEFSQVLEHLLRSFIYLVGIIVANVPEGLLATVTVCLSLTAKKMKKQNCLVKHLEAVETLGSTSTICSDKTGTLTQNKMTCIHLWYDEILRDCRTGNDEAILTNSCETETWEWLIKIAILCNKVKFVKEENETLAVKFWKYINGDASEAAILKACEIERGNHEEVRNSHPKLMEVPFNSKNKYQYSIHECPNTDEYVLVMKGAPEVVFEKCTVYMNNGGLCEIDSKFKTTFNEQALNMASLGERVLGFCFAVLPKEKYPKNYEFKTDDQSYLNESLCFVGLMGLADPPRDGVKEAVKTSRSAGIRVVMVTGDHPATARAIAREVGIIEWKNETADQIAERAGIVSIKSVCELLKGLDDNDGNFDTLQQAEIILKLREPTSIVIHGNELAKLTPKDLEIIIQNYHEIVFARTSPQQKLIIVEGFQNLGNIVAVTGDGVNDSPALKKANIGIAMGITGADVSKQAADMILMDDNFSSIVTGVKEGRLIFDNLKKSIAYTLTSNIPEITPFLFYIFFQIPLPLGIIHILCIDLGTDLIPAISLAYEKAESEIMLRKPRDAKRDRLVNNRLISMAYGQIGILQAAAGFFTYFVIMASNGFLPLALFGISVLWEDSNHNSLPDSYGVEWNYEARKQLEYTCNTGFFVTIVITQWADVLICKTRKNSIFQQKGVNYWMIIGIFFETALAMGLTYIPYLNNVLKMYYLRPEWLVLPFSFTILIFIYDEVRKLLIRLYPGKWVERETYY